MQPRYHYFLLCIAALGISIPAAPVVYGQTGNCAPGTGESMLETNNVRARIFNSGALFWQSGSAVYEVPKGSGVSSIFTTSLWVGGFVNNELRVAAARYGSYEFWPGPLDADGNPPDDCSSYDRLYKITAEDLATFNNSGFVSPRLRDWPWQIGAPVIDGDGDPNNYNLLGGDRPELLGQTSLWWAMNDRGNNHLSTNSEPLGLEVHGTAFSGPGEGDLDNTTFYRYKLIYKGTEPLRDAYVGLFVDADLGNFDDDYIGADTVLGIAYTYNGDNDDEGHYGEAPPALGMAFLQGPLADNDGLDNDGDGAVDETDERMRMTTFTYPTNGGGPMGDPNTRQEYYNYMTGKWKDGQPVTFGGDGRSFSNIPTRFVFTGDPVTNSFWSERNADNIGTHITPAERRFIMATGPFNMEPGETEEIGVAIVWARGADHLDSITQLRQSPVFENPFPTTAFGGPIVGTPPTGPTMLAAPGDGAFDQPTNTTLRWDEVAGATGYLVQWAKFPVFEQYDQGDPLVVNQVTTIEVHDTSFLGDFAPNVVYYWRALPFNDSGTGTWSTVYTFSTSTIEHNLASIGFSDFTVVANANGVLDPPAGASPDWNGFPGTGRPSNGTQPQQTNGSQWFIHTGGPRSSYDQFVDRVTRSGSRWSVIAPYDYEIRFTDQGGKCLEPFLHTPPVLMDVPFELWRIGVNTPDDTSDDVRMFCHLLDEDGNRAFGLQNADHMASGSNNDPYTDWIYFTLPDNDTPGEAGYNNLVAAFENSIETPFTFEMTRILDRIVLVNWNGGNVGVGIYDADLPEAGTIFRISGVEPVAPLPSAPADGATDISGNITLWWHGVATDVEVALDPTFASPLVSDTTTGASFTLTDLPFGQTYFWRIGNLGRWSPTWSFTPGGGVAANTEADGLPTRFQLDQNYPNPFNPATTFRFGLPQASHAIISIYNALGQQVAVVTDGTFSAGWHTLQWNASGLSSGLYFYQIQAGTYQETRKMMLLK